MKSPRGRANLEFAALFAFAFAIAAIEFFAVTSHRPGAPPAQPPATQTQAPAPTTPATPAQAAPQLSPTPIGFIDAPTSELVLADSLDLRGWALDRAGVRRVEVRVDGTPYEARYGLPRPDVAKDKPAYPNAAHAGFDFRRDFAGLAPIRHDVAVVAIASDGREAVIARMSLVPPAAMHRASALLDARPALAAEPFTFLMMTSGVVDHWGAVQLDSVYRGYESRTTRVGMSVPILYLRTTKGAAGDYAFDPDFDLARKCKDRPIADDNLDGVIRYAVEHRIAVQFILNGGIWADATCDDPEWDANDMLEQDVANCQWTAQNEVFPDDYLKNLPGSTNSPELARSLTYNVYAARVRSYKRRNLQAAARVIAAFAREHPDLFVGVALDADTYMNPFFGMRGLFKVFDYNPGMLRQFRHWLRGDGPYAGKPEPGAPDLRAYRRATPLTLAEVNRIARKHWTSWDQVDPPRAFPGAPGAEALRPGETPIWDDPWFQEWQVFRQHVVGLHYSELSEWAHEAGLPKDSIYSAQGFIAPDPGHKPFAILVTSRGQNYDTSGVSIEGSIPRDGHLGAIVYGDAAENHVPMEGRHSLFATFGRMDPGWGVVEYNPTELKRPTVLPVYAQAYHSFRDMFNYGASEVSAMAWNGSNGIFVGQPGYVPYTAWRNTPAEDAMRDFLVTHADVPRGALLWTFGSARHADSDGWTAERGKAAAHDAYLALTPSAGAVKLRSPDDLVVRPRSIDLAILDFGDGAKATRSTLYARADGDAEWRDVGSATGDTTRIALRWPPQWSARNAVVVQVALDLAFDGAAADARLARVMLYPKR